MRIEMAKGRYGKDDKKILFTSTGKNDTLIEREPITIFKLGVSLKQSDSIANYR